MVYEALKSKTKIQSERTCKSDSGSIDYSECDLHLLDYHKDGDKTPMLGANTSLQKWDFFRERKREKSHLFVMLTTQ